MGFMKGALLIRQRLVAELWDRCCPYEVHPDHMTAVMLQHSALQPFNERQRVESGETNIQQVIHMQEQQRLVGRLKKNKKNH